VRRPRRPVPLAVESRTIDSFFAAGEVFLGRKSSFTISPPTLTDPAGIEIALHEGDVHLKVAGQDTVSVVGRMGVDANRHLELPHGGRACRICIAFP